MASSSVSSRPPTETSSASGATKRKRSSSYNSNAAAIMSSQPGDTLPSQGQPQMTAYPGGGGNGGVSGPQGPPRHYHGIPFLPPQDMNGMGSLPLVNGGPYPLYAPPNAGPPPMYNNHHMEPPPATSTATTSTTTTSRGGKNGNGKKGNNGGSGNNGSNGSSDGGSSSHNGHAMVAAPATSSPSRQPPSNGGNGSSSTTPAMPPDMYLPPHGARPPPGDYDVLQGLAAIPVLPPGHGLTNGVQPIPGPQGYAHSMAAALGVGGLPVLSQYPFAALQAAYPGGIPSALSAIPGLRPPGAITPLNPQLESKLKEAIEQGQPVQHLKLLIEGHMKLEEKKHKKRAANRRSASSSRARKKKFIEKLAHENRRLKRVSRILAVLPDLVMVVNEEGNITFASWRSQKVLHSAKQLAGQPIYDVVVPECHDKVRAAIKRTLEDGGANGTMEMDFSDLKPSHTNGLPASTSTTPAPQASGITATSATPATTTTDMTDGEPHHSSGGINSQRQCAQQASSHHSTRDHQSRKNQVCLKRADGTLTWCTMRTTLFFRPLSLRDDEKEAGVVGDGANSDDEGSDASGEMPQGGENGGGAGLGVNEANTPEVILCFRPLEKESINFIKQEIIASSSDSSKRVVNNGGSGSATTTATTNSANPRPLKKQKVAGNSGSTTNPPSSTTSPPPLHPTASPPLMNGTSVHHADHRLVPVVPSATTTEQPTTTGLPPLHPGVKHNGGRAATTTSSGNSSSSNINSGKEVVATAPPPPPGNGSSGSTTPTGSNGVKKGSKDHAAIELEAAKSLMRMGKVGSGDDEEEKEA